jgi:CheY-like chemotaxis protein
MDALSGLPLFFAEDRLWRLQRENHSPHPMNLSNALLAFREEVERGRIDGLEWKFPRAKDGTICMFNVNEFALMNISFRVADVLRTWPDWPPTLAWNAAKTRPWQAPRGISKVWIRSLPAGDYLPFADVVDLVAFGRAKMAIGLSDIDEHAADKCAALRKVMAGNRLLLVEDEALTGMMMRDMLTELGFDVIGPFGRVADAMAAARCEDFHAAVLDVNLDGEMVYSIADAVGARGVPFVFVTGYGVEGIDGRFAQVLVLQKPIERQMLQSVFLDGGQRVGPAVQRYPNGV